MTYFKSQKWIRFDSCKMICRVTESRESIANLSSNFKLSEIL